MNTLLLTALLSTPSMFIYDLQLAFETPRLPAEGTLVLAHGQLVAVTETENGRCVYEAEVETVPVAHLSGVSEEATGRDALSYILEDSMVSGRSFEDSVRTAREAVWIAPCGELSVEEEPRPVFGVLQLKDGSDELVMSGGIVFVSDEPEASSSVPQDWLELLAEVELEALEAQRSSPVYVEEVPGVMPGDNVQ
jgi:hypothetical protein